MGLGVMKGDVFHILNRGVEKRAIFYNEKDRLRFIYGLYDFNDANYAFPYPYRCKTRSLGHATSEWIGRERKELVDLLCWVAMPNHSHNLIQEKIDGGGSIFSKKIFGGHTKYINEKYQRSGVLFQGRSKIIKVERDPHFFYLPFYILSNPLKLIEPHWKERGIRNMKKAVDFLENYPWSSFLDVIGKENFPLLVNKDLFYEIFQTSEKKFKKEFFEWLESYTGTPLGRATSKYS